MTEQVYTTRLYDAEIHLAGPLTGEDAQALEAVAMVERWGSADVTVAGPSGLPLRHAYPDGGHGSFHLLGVPDRTALIDLGLLAGRWLEPGEAHGVVLNQVAAARLGPDPVGRAIDLVVEGRTATWRVVGVVREVAAPAIAYVSDAAFVARTEQPLGMLRVQALGSGPRGDRAAAARAGSAVVQRVLRERGVRVAKLVPLELLFNAMGEHVVVLIRSLVVLALMMAVVGIIGLAANTSTNIVERTRELAVIRAVGASARQVRWMLLLLVSTVASLVPARAALPTSVSSALRHV